MTNTNGKRDHSEIVISNVEFAMMQFYKMQFESAQQRMATQEKVIKKQRRDNQHLSQQLHNANEQIRGHLADVRVLTDALDRSLEARDALITGLRETENTNIELLNEFREVLNDHPEIDHSVPIRLAQITDRAIQTRDQLGLAALMLLSTETFYDSDQETEPDLDNQDWLDNL